jgi:hypothetical protein
VMHSFLQADEYPSVAFQIGKPTTSKTAR